MICDWAGSSVAWFCSGRGGWEFQDWRFVDFYADSAKVLAQRFHESSFGFVEPVRDRVFSKAIHLGRCFAGRVLNIKGNPKIADGKKPNRDQEDAEEDHRRGEYPRGGKSDGRGG